MGIFIPQKAWEKMKGYRRLDANRNLILRKKLCLLSWRKLIPRYPFVHFEHHPQKFIPVRMLVPPGV